MLQHVNPLRLLAAGEREGAALREGHLLEGMVLVLNVDVLAGRGPIAQNADCGRMQPDGREPVGMRIGKRTQQQRVDHAEDGGIGADADGQRGHDDQGQAPRSCEACERRSENPGTRWLMDPPALDE